MTGVQPFVVHTIGAMRVAFIGLTAPRSRAYPQTRGLVTGDPVGPLGWTLAWVTVYIVAGSVPQTFGAQGASVCAPGCAVIVC